VPAEESREAQARRRRKRARSAELPPRPSELLVLSKSLPEKLLTIRP
jgi:hypothetical protein